MVARPQVILGGIPVQLDFAGIVSAGLYQFNFKVPVNLASGDQPLQAFVNGVPTPADVFIVVE